MKIIKGKLIKDLNRNLFWSKLTFKSGKKVSLVFFCAPNTYLAKNNILEKGKNSLAWIDTVAKKWSILRNDIFNQKVHYDIYSSDPNAEAKCLSFLLKKSSNASLIC